MTRRRKLWTLLLLGIAVLAVVLLSANLSEFALLPGRPFALPEEAPGETGGSGQSSDRILAIVLLVFVGFSGLLLLLAIIYLVISPEVRKRMLKQLVPMLLFLLVYYYFMARAKPGMLDSGEGLPTTSTSPQPLPTAPTVEFVADPPQWLVLATRFGFALLLATFLVGIIWFVWHRRRRRVSPLKRLAEEAEDALQAIQAGADLKDTVMRCYFEMNQILSEQRDIRRHDAMTPREFESYLEKTGLPSTYVQRLTRLFEMVRYGAKVPGEDEERQAIACLTAIAEFCRSTS